MGFLDLAVFDMQSTNLGVTQRLICYRVLRKK